MFENTSGYFARTPEGTAYISGQTNTALMGMGLHIYGRNNTVIQQADLLAGGIGATGIRIDGSENTLTIPAETKVHANGEYGTGLLVAYGRNHNITHNGSLQATGLEGIAARFDFGNNSVGNSTQYRGSYIFSKRGESMPDELNGSLVNNFNVNGELTGSQAAIFISRNALVDNINIAPQAVIVGDIISKYSEPDDDWQQRLTHINFSPPHPSDNKTDYQYFYMVILRVPVIL